MGLPDIDNIPDTGAVFTIGRSRFADNVASHFFIRRDPVIEITCGDEHSAVICQSGRLFVFGSNDWGQLGLGHKNHVSKPSCVKTLKPEKVTHVACGRAHTLICTGGQKIFSCGSDQEGQLGRGSLASGDSSSTPVMVYDCDTGGRKSVIQVATGSHHSMILTSDGAVLAWGSNLEGQLGLPGVSGLVNKPTKLQIPEAVKHISAGYYHSAFLTENGLIYVCGESESGKLGVVVNFSTQATPKQLQLPAASATIACGGHHTLVLTENGDLYCFGSNASGQLGIGVDTAEVLTPKLLPRNSLESEKVLKIACGESHSAIVTESGKVFIAGDGRHGKLGLEENENNVHELTFATRYRELFVTNVSCGGCHTILTGRRRIGSNDESDTLQMDSVIQKRNSLPPLKVPMNRLQAETLQEKIVSEADNSNIDPDSQIESPEVVQNTVLGDIEERKASQTPAPQTMAPRVEKPETPKKLSDYMAETASDSMEENMLSEMNRVEESKVINEELSKISQSNLKEMERTKSTAGVRLSNSAKSRNAEEQKNQSSITSNAVDNSTIEKSSSSEQPVPPPKPPRQKLGSAENSITEKLPSPQSTLTSSGVPRDEVEIARNVLSAPTVPTDDIVIEKIEETIAKEAEKIVDSVTTDEQKSSLLAESKAAIDGIVEIDNKNNVEEKEAKEKSTQEMELETKPVTDNSEVVPSPAFKTGKMGKLFKNKKQVELENGTKESDTTNVKAKSKACSIL